MHFAIDLKRAGPALCAVLAACFCAALPRDAGAQDLVAKTEARTPEEQKKSFKLPPGFEIQLVAADPDIHKPMNIAFDARGRLWVTDTVEYPYPAKDGTKPRDTVKVLEDFGPDGKARKVTTFADGLNIPLGVLPAADGNGAIVYSIPQIARHTDTDGDGRADKREVVLQTYGFNDTHGMTNHFTVGFDGWVYADHGFNNTSTVRARDGSEITMQSGNVYRFKADGSRVEYFTRGQVNPFGLCFDPRGDLYSADCHTRPQYMLLRGAYYPSFGKPHDGLGYGPEMMQHSHGSTAIAGTVYYDAGHYPPEYRGTLFNGNPVTNRINRDKIEWHGSSPKAVELPDFLSSSDPWFRPVDLVLGPDGALYVADFYNRIIGHYEVPLTHPGRDRERGRIWRVVYRGPDGKGEIPAVPNLGAYSAAPLAEALGDENLAVRMTAANQLVDRVGAPAAEAVRPAVEKSTNPKQKAQGLWVLHRLGALPAPLLAAAASDGDALVRVHAMRVLSETKAAGWTPATRELAAAGLKDADPFVRRAAADALGRHPGHENVRPLLDLLHATPGDDSHLRHVVRMSLRDQLSADGAFTKLAQAGLKPEDENALADVAAGAAGPEVGAFLVQHIRSGRADKAKVTEYLLTASRLVPESEVDGLAKLVLETAPDDLDLQRQLFTGLLEGLARRGARPGQLTRAWGAELAKKLLSPDARPDPAAWKALPPPGSPGPAAEWKPEKRDLAGGGSEMLLSSLPAGERATGLVRSREFDLPAKLSLYVCGHYGPPGTNDAPKNFVRVRLAGTNEVVAETPPPRNDTARRVEFDLSKHKGKKGYIEAADGESRGTYAWVAFGRLDPPVVPMPAGGGDALRDRLVAASAIARALKLSDLRGQLQEVASAGWADPQARAGAARALGVMSDAPGVKVLASIAGDPNVPPVLRDAVQQSLGELNSDEGRAALLTAVAVAPQQLQRSLAVALASSPAGAAALLEAVAAGKASPRLLREPNVLERLRAANVADLDVRVAALTRGQPSPDEQAAKLIAERVAAYAPAGASAERGRQVFAKNCAACHQLDNVGANIGPQLAGVGQRGLERVAEDVLDPSRNVDAAFRTTIVQLEGGQTQAGLARREEGELLILADATGKEQSVPKSKVKRRVESNLSLMPGNFGEIIPPGELNDLLAYLLSK